jgi:tetratricopeptide (TPR) repeat protein
MLSWNVMNGILIRAIAVHFVVTVLLGCGATSREPDSAESVHEAWYARLDEAEAVEDALRRCLAVPDPQGYKWPTDLLRALCQDNRSPVANAQVVRPLIDRADWSALHAHYDGYLDRHHRKIDPELLLHRAFPKASWKSHEEEDDYTSRWLKAAPEDPYAILLRARFLIDKAWSERGQEFASKVPIERMRRAVALAKEASVLAKRAVALEPRLVPAYELLIRAGALTGDRGQSAAALRDALHQSPHSYYARAIALDFLQPKWGGSLEQMDHLVEEAQKHLHANPRLILLRVERASLDGDAFSARGQHGPALDAYKRALALGPDLSTVEAAVYAAQQTGRLIDVVMFASQGLRFSRTPGWMLTTRGTALERLGELPRALRDYAKAAELAPADPDPQYRMAWLEHQRQNFEAAERHYLKVLELAPDHADAMTNVCRMWVHLTLEPRKAKPYAERLTVLRPDDPDSWLLLANIHHSLGDPLVHISARRFLELAPPDDPRWKNSVEIINRFLAAQAAEQQQR